MVEPGVGKVVPLRAQPTAGPAEQTFEEMLLGWRRQQMARNLAFATINAREADIRRSVAQVGEYPRRWSPQMVDEWLGDQRAVRHLRQSTIRSKAVTLRLFFQFLTDPDYEWPERCWARPETPPGPGVPFVEHGRACPGGGGPGWAASVQCGGVASLF